tara:strand:+ start:25 stop:843 length:819 start_codon:yes stop_codon:yes gene_type:complete
MKILITGGSGFVGKNLIKSLKEDHEIFFPNSKELDLTNSESVDNYFRTKYFDWVIHCAIKGGKRTTEDSLDITYKNLSMFFNLMRNRDRYNKLINFSTGAEFDRSKDITGDNDVNNYFPLDCYGLSKNIISRLIKNNSTDYNLRIFGVFGIDEEPDRFFKINILKSKNEKPIEIHQDRYFDFIYIKDLILVVKHYLRAKKELLPLELDLVYPTKHKLSDIAELFPGLNQIQIQSRNRDKSYLGSAVKNISSLDPNLNFIGLEKGIKEVYNEL